MMYRTTSDGEARALNQEIHISDVTCELDSVDPSTLHDEVCETRAPAAPGHFPAPEQTLEEQPKTSVAAALQPRNGGTKEKPHPFDGHVQLLCASYVVDDMVQCGRDSTCICRPTITRKLNALTC